jgi:hypothetical protein
MVQMPVQTGSTDAGKRNLQIKTPLFIETHGKRRGEIATKAHKLRTGTSL